MSGTFDVEVQLGVKISLREGTELAAVVYRPRRQAAPLPVIFMLTPYLADTYHERGVYFAANGYPFVIVDSRGRGESEGHFTPFAHEGNDGYDVTEWLVRQSYCDGQVAMWGGSYNGFCQWATAKEGPPNLSTIVPAAAPYLGLDFPMRSNIFQPYVIRWLLYVDGRTAHTEMFKDERLWSQWYRQWHESGGSFRALDSVLGKGSKVFQQWLDHPKPDEYWDSQNPTSAEYSNISIPILTITGAYDDDQPGALRHYANHVANSPNGENRHYLVIGPWDHAGTRTPKAHFGGLHVGKASLIDLPALHIQWYTWVMRNGPRPSFLQNLVAYYVTGAEKWCYVNRLAEATTRYDTYYMSSSGASNGIFASGVLSKYMLDSGPDSYTYDPNGCEAAVDAEACVSGSSLVDQTVLQALDTAVLVYQTPPFPEDVEITGFVRARLWIAIDCPDTDIYVSLHEVALDGKSLRLTQDALRARHREGPRTEKLINTRGPLCYEFRNFTFIARQVKRRHRLRLVVAPIGRLLEATFAEKNHNDGGIVADETRENGRVVCVTLFHDERHPSALELPIGRLDGQEQEKLARREHG